MRKLISLEMMKMTILNRLNVQYFFGTPAESQIIWFWFACFAIMLILTIAIYFYFRAKGMKIRPYRLYAKTFLWPNVTLSVVGIVLTLSRYESLALLSWRFWVYVTVLGSIVFNVWFFMVRRNRLEDELVRFYDKSRKDKWMKTSRK